MTPEDFLRKWVLADHPGGPRADLAALLIGEIAKAREEQREADAVVLRHRVAEVRKELDVVRLRLDEWKARAEERLELARQGEANEAKLHEALGWAGEFHADLPVPTRVTLEVVDRLRRAERERDELLKLAYLGEHRFPDLTFKARLEELVPKLRKAERERDEARKTCPLLGDRLGSPGIIERSLAVKCLCVEFGPAAAKEPAR